MTATFTTVGATHQTLTMTFADFRGQKKTVKIELDPAITDADVVRLVTAADNLSNAKVIGCTLTSSRTLGGFKSNAVSTGHEINIDELMEYVLYATNPLNPAKKVARAVGIPAMLGDQETVAGTPVPVSGVGGDTNPAPTAGVQLDMYNLLSVLQSSLRILGADGAWYTPTFVYSPTKSHHVEIGDVVDTL